MFRAWTPRSQEEVTIMSENNQFLINRIMEDEE
jgi:hypothetical protein